MISAQMDRKGSAKNLASLAAEITGRAAARDVAHDILCTHVPNVHPMAAAWVMSTGDRFLGIEFFEGFIAIYSRSPYIRSMVHAQIYKTQKNAKHAFRSQSYRGIKEAKYQVAEEIAKETKIETCAIGDVYVSTLSYSMTSNQFYEVIAIRGSKVVLSHCAKVRTKGDGWSGSERCGEIDRTNSITVTMRKGIPFVGGRALKKTTRDKDHYFNNLD